MARDAVELRVQSDPNALATYYPFVVSAGYRTKPGTIGFQPSYDLPPLDDRLTSFFAASGLAAAELEPYRGRTLRLLNLMRNPRTRTTKTIGSLTIVARAIRHIRDSGRRLMIVTPTSGNKGTALRDAVLRAYECGLVGPDELRITTIVPRESVDKLWSSTLAEDAALRRVNPVLLYRGADPEGVKAIARTVVEAHGREVSERFGVDLWYTLELGNYRVADAIRAAFEADRFPADPDYERVHAHAVSSAYGLLGYELGYRMLFEHGDAPSRHPSFFVVQHLAVPDMVMSLRYGEVGAEARPRYHHDSDTGLYVQEEDPAFPSTTYDPFESIDSTFYSKQPATSSELNALVHSHGGDGIVVSLYECLQRYGEVRRELEPADVSLPADPRRLREWALVMVMTGVLNAIDRDLIAERADVVIHASGSYGVDDFSPLVPEHTIVIDDAATASDVVVHAAQ